MNHKKTVPKFCLQSPVIESTKQPWQNALLSIFEKEVFAYEETIAFPVRQSTYHNKQERKISMKIVNTKHMMQYLQEREVKWVKKRMPLR